MSRDLSDIFYQFVTLLLLSWYIVNDMNFIAISHTIINNHIVLSDDKQNSTLKCLNNLVLHFFHLQIQLVPKELNFLIFLNRKMSLSYN